MKASRILFVMAIAIAALSGCRKHDRPERQNPGSGGNEGGNGQQQEQTVIKITENKNWVWHNEHARFAPSVMAAAKGFI